MLHKPASPRARSPRPALFVDKDGTLIHNVPYKADPALVSFMPGALEAMALLQAAGFALVIVSNQSGIALRRFTQAQFELLRTELRRRLLEEAGVRLDDFLYCPHAAPQPGRDTGTSGCACRKPRPGMLLEAARRHGLCMQRSWMVGDTLDDVEAGHRAGCRSVLYDSGGETVWRRSVLRDPDVVARDWRGVLRAVQAQTDEVDAAH